MRSLSDTTHEHHDGIVPHGAAIEATLYGQLGAARVRDGRGGRVRAFIRSPRLAA